MPHAISSGAFRDFGTLGLGRDYGVFTLVILAPWAFVGFESICFDTAHFKFAAKRAKWVIFAAILVAGFIYATMPVVAVSFVPDGYASWGAYVVDLDKLSGVASVPTFNAARAYMGNFGLAVMAVSALAAIFTGMSTSGVTLFALLLYSALMWIAKRLVAEGDASVRGIVVRGGVVLMLIVFVGLAVMMYIQNLIRKKHEVIEREKIRAVETAENGQIAVDRVAASEPGYYSLVLMDIQMPVMDGYTATRTIRALEDPALAGVPIVAMTANAFAEDVQAAREAGMQAHIAKPVDIAVLHRTLQDVLRGRRS